MTDSNRQPVHYAWGRFFNRFWPYIHTRFWKLNGYEGIPQHSHEFMEFLIVSGGSLPHWTIKGKTVLQRGDVVLLRPGSWHAFGEARHLKAFNLCFIESAVRSYVPLLADDPVVSNLLLKSPLDSGNRGVLNLHFAADVMQQLVPLLERLDYMEHHEDTHVFAIEKIGLFTASLGLMARAIYPSHPQRDEKPICVSVRRAMELMENDITHAWSLQSVADAININKSYLARLFRRDTGMTLLDFMMRRRAERAAVFLVNTDKPVSQIAQLTGWDDPNYFARRFRCFYGMSASEYRTAARSRLAGETASIL